jgi:hypothetical protein
VIFLASSNFFGYSAGMSAGFVPRRILWRSLASIARPPRRSGLLSQNRSGDRVIMARVCCSANSQLPPCLLRVMHVVLSVREVSVLVLQHRTSLHRGNRRGGPTNRQRDARVASYFARFQTTSVVPPVDAMGFVSFSSSADTAKDRFWSVPFQFGNELPTT